ncbi:membrane-associated protein, putative [Bodo saltans]|uniref:Membrane-associated protein, putative n=1 Tax=Bodo saltans TaxID=75058 RepID=A0A0S4IXW2_BODSA|nr:membrane-associated protein, putative [Bodo saltans]|eukprot:CUG11415.1 membrane-associated protein, putative [Bodo saltans]
MREVASQTQRVGPNSHSSIIRPRLHFLSSICMYAIIMILAQLAALVPSGVNADSIPCVMQQPFTIQSNGQYILENCTAPATGVPPFVYLTTGSPAPLALSNVTLDVIGGGVMPSIYLGAALISNVTVTMSGLRVGPFVFSPNATDPSWVWFLSTPAATNVSLTCIDVTMDITFVFHAASIPTFVGLFVLISSDFGQISNISVHLIDSRVSFHYITLQPPPNIELYACNIRIATYVNTSIGAISIEVINSRAFHIVNNSLALSNSSSYGTAVYYLALNTHGLVKGSNVRMVVHNSSITVIGYFGGLFDENTTQNVTSQGGAMSVFSTSGIHLSNLYVSFNHSSVSIASVCTYACAGYTNVPNSSFHVVDLNSMAIGLGDSAFLEVSFVDSTIDMSMGSKLYVFGFTASAESNAVASLHPSFVIGVTFANSIVNMSMGSNLYVFGFTAPEESNSSFAIRVTFDNSVVNMSMGGANINVFTCQVPVSKVSTTLDLGIQVTFSNSIIDMSMGTSIKVFWCSAAVSNVSTALDSSLVIQVTFRNCIIALASPGADLFAVSCQLAGGDVSIDLFSTNFTLLLNGPAASQRNVGAVAVSGDTTRNAITVHNCTIHAAMDSNLCSIASAEVLAINGTSAQLSVLLSGVVLVATLFPRDNTSTILPIIPNVFYFMAMGSSLLAIVSPPSTAIRSSLFVVSNSHVIASHMCNIPSATTTVTLIVSVVCAIGVVGALEDSTIDISNVSVTRRFPDTRNFPASWANPNDSLLNVTTILQLSYQSSVPFSTLFQGGSPYAALLAQIIVNSSVNNVTASVNSNCVVAYDTTSGVAPIATDVLSFVILPTLLNASIIFVNTGTISTVLPYAGQAVAVVGPAAMVGSTLVVEDVARLTSLLDVVFDSLAFTGACSQFAFRNMSLAADKRNDGNNNKALIGSRNIGTVRYSKITSTGDTLLSQPSLFSISHCSFSGFDVLFSSSFVPNAMNGDSRILDLGCNLWNTAPLPISVITGADKNTRAFRRSCVVYEPSAYNASLYCAGIVPSGTARVSLTLLPQDSVSVSRSPHTQSRSPKAGEELTALHDVSEIIATTTSRIATYTSLVFSAARGTGGISTIQRSMLAIRLAAMCDASSSAAGGDDTGSQQQSLLAAEEATVFSDLFFNPLSFSVPIGVAGSFVNGAAGTLIGNTLMACFVGCVSHWVWRLEGKHAVPPFMLKVVSVFVLVFPLPGALANIAKSLLQPSVGAAVSLVVSSERAPSSVVVGVVLCIPWIAYVVHGSWWMLLRGRPAGQFLLGCKANHFEPLSLSAHPQQNDRKRITRRITSFVADAQTARTEWVMPRGLHGSDGSGDHRQFGAWFLLRRLRPIFEPFTASREWYCVVEWAVLLVGSVVLGVATAVSAGSGSATCSFARWGARCILVLGLVSVAAAATLRPFCVPLELWMALLLGALECLSTALVLANDVYAAQIVVTISAVVETCVCVLPMILAATKAGVCSFMCDQRDMQRSEETDIASRRVRKAGTRPIIGAKSRGANVFEATQQTQLRALVELVCSTASRSK